VEPSALHDQIVNESGRIYAGTSAILEDYLPGTVVILGVGSILFQMNVQLALIVVAFGIGILLLSRKLGVRVKQHVKAQHRAFEAFSRSVLRTLRALDLIHTHAAEASETARHREVIVGLEETGIRRAMWGAGYSATQGTLLSVAAASVLILGGVLVVRDQITLGDLVSFYAGFALLRGPMGTLSQRGPALIEGIQSLGRMVELLDETDQAPYKGSLKPRIDGHLRLVDITFGYGPEPVVEDVSFEIHPGQIVALVGPNGSGKSTIVSLILGFYRPEKGELLIEGVAYPDLDISHLRRSIGVVHQQPILLHESVRDNIAFGRDSVSEVEIREALRIASATEFVDALAEGLDTDIGTDGVFLSGGQQQRLALARSVVHRPRLLILDEPTNHLDQEAVSTVMDNIRSMSPRPAVLVISHQLDQLAGVDQIVELKAGRVISIGPGHSSEDRD
jgi:ABC-type multidrug transport system fused ATPase/permease subunit